MTSLIANSRDLRACLLAAGATLLTVTLAQTPVHSSSLGHESSAAKPSDEQAMRGLINAGQAQTEGRELLGEAEADAAARLSFAPEYQRLVWRVEGVSSSVLLDAVTGEALEFVFD